METGTTETGSRLATYFILVFMLTWGMWIPAALATEGMLPFQIPVTLAGLLGAWAPGLAAIALAAISDIPNGLRALFARLGSWRIGLRSQLFGSSLGEELGMRGFALPRMQSRQGALWASIVLGLMWGLWHLPRIWVPGEPFDFVSAGWLILGLVLNAILYTWLFDNTRGSLIPVILLHTSQALTSLFMAQTDSPLIESLLLVAPVALVILFAMPFRSEARG